MTHTTLINKLFNIRAITFGEGATLNSGLVSPHYYIDMRVIVSYPEILKEVADCLWEKIKDKECDFICGVPYAGLPIATAMSLNHNKPMLMRRKEKKDHGRKKIIEGVYKPGQKVIIVEDLFTTGSSTIETIIDLEKEDLIVTDIVILIDRQQGGVQRLQKMGYPVHVVFSLNIILDQLRIEKKITQEQSNMVINYAKENQFQL